jgi:predicted metal-dependent hydrolase
VTVDRDGVTVVLPQRTSEREAHRAVEQFDPWIRKQLAVRDAAAARVEAREGMVLWKGALTPLVISPEIKSARFDGECFRVPNSNPQAALERLYRRKAKQDIAKRLDNVTKACGTEWTSLRIGDMKTRWASCSAGGRMSFSWRLMMAPDEVIDSVVWHEVCHIEEPNHSHRFWALLDTRWPSHRDDRAWLTEHAAELIF